MTLRDAEYFLELQTQTGWGRTLAGFAAWCQAQPGWRVLDVGCGPGLLPALFARQGCPAFGIDLDTAMFLPQPLHLQVLCAQAEKLPFASGIFDLVTASNLLFLLADPRPVLGEMRRVTHPGGMLALLNPSELLDQKAAAALADARALDGLARQTLLNWAGRAEANQRWTEQETRELLVSSGIQPVEISLKIGPGFARFTRGRV
jgi:ubiquinone/menaquinone biosynthesis C-methylase UbiE